MITKELLLDNLANDLSEPNLLIFKNSVDLSSVEDNPSSFHIVVNDNYMKNWVENKCLSLITSYFDHIEFSIVIKEPELLRKHLTNLNYLMKTNERFQMSRFNSQFTFDRFIVGNNNRFAYAAAVAVAQKPSKAYNPLYIYGSVGIGKTHLMHAIANEISSQDLNVCLVTSEKFTNDLINSIKNGSTSEFKNKYRSIDVLLIDDIQFLSGKESTQEEFFHTFNDLHSQNKQIVITSDCPPKKSLLCKSA